MDEKETLKNFVKKQKTGCSATSYGEFLELD